LRKITAILLIVGCFASCKDKDAVPTGILGKEKMRAVFWDVITAEAFTTGYIKKDSTKNLVLEDAKLQHQAFAINHVTKEEFYTSYDYYRMHPELMSDLLDSMADNRADNSPIKNPRQFHNGIFPNRRAPFVRDSFFNGINVRLRDSLYRTNAHFRDSINRLPPISIKKK